MYRKGQVLSDIILGGNILENCEIDKSLLENCELKGGSYTRCLLTDCHASPNTYIAYCTIYGVKDGYDSFRETNNTVREGSINPSPKPSDLWSM